MNSEQLTQLSEGILEENKGRDISSMDVRKLTDITDTMIVCTATSSRHARTLADKLVRAAKEAGIRPLGVEGEQPGEWILVDLVDVVIHIMLPETRVFYSLEKLWATIEKVREASES